MLFCVDLFEHCYTDALEHREGAPTADGDMSSRILIGPIRLKHCDTNIDALCVRCVLENMVGPLTADGELHQLEFWMSFLHLQFAHWPSSQEDKPSITTINVGVTVLQKYSPNENSR